MSCLYSLDGSHKVLSDEFPLARVSGFFSMFLHLFVSAKLATRSMRVNPQTYKFVIFDKYLNIGFRSDKTNSLQFVMGLYKAIVFSV